MEFLVESAEKIVPGSMEIVPPSKKIGQTRTVVSTDTTDKMNIILSSIEKNKNDGVHNKSDDLSEEVLNDSSTIATLFIDNLKFPFKLPSILKKEKKIIPSIPPEALKHTSTSEFTNFDEVYKTSTFKEPTSKVKESSSSLFITNDEAYSSKSSPIENDIMSVYVESPEGGFDSTFVDDIVSPLKGKMKAIYLVSSILALSAASVDTGITPVEVFVCICICIYSLKTYFTLYFIY
jgi:hypothetical protein